MTESIASVNTIMNVFTAGTFPVRPFLCMAYGMLALCAVLLRSALPKILGKKTLRRYRRIDPYIRWAVFLSMALLFSLPVLSEFRAYKTYGIPPKSVAIFITGDEVTSTRVAHTHFGKVVVPLVLGSRDTAVVSLADTGAALLPYVPSSVPRVSLILLLCAAIGSLLVVARLAGDIPGKSRKAAFLVLYTLLGFLSLDKAVDGGFVSDAAGIVFFAYGALTLFPPRAFSRLLAGGGLLYGVVLWYLHAAGFYWPDSYFFEALQRSAVLLLTLYALHYSAYGKQRIWKGVLLIAAVSSIVVLSQVLNADEREGLQAPISPPHMYLSVMNDEAKPPLPVIGTIGRLTVYDTSPLIGKTVSAASDLFKLPYWYQPFTSGTENCAEHPREKEESFKVLSPVPLQDIQAPSGLAAGTFEFIETRPAGWYRYDATITYHACISRYFSVLQEVLRLAGSDTAIVYDLHLGSKPQYYIDPASEYYPQTDSR